MVLNGQGGFETMQFEAQVPTGLGGTPPHLDLRLDATDHVVAIESKCLEYLVPKPAKFAAAYETITDHRAHSPWFRHLTLLRNEPGHYRYLDAAQLIKHYLGLAQQVPDRAKTLLYLYWEPRNWEEFLPFIDHRHEIGEFRERVAGDAVRFDAMSYHDLWAAWEQSPDPAWLPAQVQRLTARYRLALPPRPLPGAKP